MVLMQSWVFKRDLAHIVGDLQSKRDECVVLHGEYMPVLQATLWPHLATANVPLNACYTN